MATEWLNNVMASQGCTCTHATATYGDVELQAEQCGTIGNNIVLSGTGAPLSEAIEIWNNNHPNNEVIVISGNPDQETLPSEEEVEFSGGSRTCTDAFNTKEDAEVLKGMFIGRQAHQQYRDSHNIKQLKMFDIL